MKRFGNGSLQHRKLDIRISHQTAVLAVSVFRMQTGNVVHRRRVGGKYSEQRRSIARTRSAYTAH